jgi:2-polyprenyl-3-methyl-5-hydroxy-6-metoxy-1,4-benzoquinol methylase
MDCGFIFHSSGEERSIQHNLADHYENIDPHEKIAVSKKLFFDFALNQLSVKTEQKKRKVLDIGCGYGYFLELAKERGWNVSGIEIVESAIQAVRRKFRDQNVFYRSFGKASFSKNCFDAITLWDVLLFINDPYTVLRECHRILKTGGVIGIRVRNVTFQKLAYITYLVLKRIGLNTVIKNPSVFHLYCFSPNSIHHLLSRLEFKNIQITNSILTSGDPYSHSKSLRLVKLTKVLISFISKFVFRISRGKWIIGPSLLIWAEKP